jgi:hypothetical protein
MVKAGILEHWEEKKNNEKSEMWVNTIDVSSLQFSKIVFYGWNKNYLMYNSR